MKKKAKQGVPETWVDWIETRSKAELQSIVYDQHVEILGLEHLIQHLKTQARANAVDEYRNEFIAVLLQPDPWSGAIPSDKEIAEKVGTTSRIVRQIRNTMGIKNPKGRPKKLA
jgi:hypothetical protein